MKAETRERLAQISILANRPAGYAVQITPREAQSILDMISDLRYAGEAVERAYRQRDDGVQREPDPRQMSLVSRYADIDEGALRR